MSVKYALRHRALALAHKVNFYIKKGPARALFKYFHFFVIFLDNTEDPSKY